ncbi:MAG: carboxynorspermidine decarboxylase [Eubacteriales bacterium]|nr:carboxynorspermidine decarboxylase [Eubacteriales bacterium]
MDYPNFDLKSVETPCYVVELPKLEKNLQVLAGVSRRTGCKILLAQKAFSMYSVYPLIAKYLDGATSSGIFEARLSAEEMGKETHVFSPAYTENEFDEIVKVSSHIVFNSFSQLKKFKALALAAGASVGIRVNPEHSTQDHAIYDPCAVGSRLGVTAANFEPNELDGVEGLHFHTLCEQNSDALEATLVAFEERFGKYLHAMKWVNFGGGHHITRTDYDIPRLERCIKYIAEKYGVTVYLEPGEAVALGTGVLVAQVIDIVDNGMKIAILDTSAACHMPDVLEMPYRPEIAGASLPEEKAYTYRIGGPTCLAGDIIGDYSFDKPLSVGDRLIFGDMAHYTMVKNNTFNGVPLPAIYVSDEDDSTTLVKMFGYNDFKARLS